MSEKKTAHVAAQLFMTPHRRFEPGAEVTEADITGDLTFEDWKVRGFIAEAADEAPNTAAD